MKWSQFHVFLQNTQRTKYRHATDNSQIVICNVGIPEKGADVRVILIPVSHGKNSDVHLFG